MERQWDSGGDPEENPKGKEGHPTEEWAGGDPWPGAAAWREELS